MKRTFEEALEHRRTYYSINNDSPVQDEVVVHIIRSAVKNVPSAFNSQSTRVVLLLEEEHRKLWNIVKEELRKHVPADAFHKTEEKIDGCFASGHGTILFFEDQEVVGELQKSFPLYSDRFPMWSQHTSGMHQLTIWTMLEDNGLGASLQHYNPLIDEAVAKEWNINPKWKLVAEMPFGVPVQEPGEKQFNPLDKRVLVFK